MLANFYFIVISFLTYVNPIVHKTNLFANGRFNNVVPYTVIKVKLENNDGAVAKKWRLSSLVEESIILKGC